MAVTTMSQAIHDALVGQRPGVGTSPTATLRSGLVSDLQAGDYVLGARAVVQASGLGAGGGSATASRTVPLLRRGELAFTVSWVNGSTVLFTR
jgi:hypothetical protein